MAKKEAFLQFLKAARSLQNRGLSKEAILQFAKNEFGEVTPLIKKQIEKVFKETKKPTVGTPAKKEATVSPIREGIETLADKKVLDKLDDVNLSADDPLGDLEKIVKGEGDTGLPKVKSDDADASPLLRIDDVNLKKLAADSEADGSSLMKKLDEIVKQKKAEATIATKTEIQGDEIFDVDPVSTDKSIPLMERVQKKVEQAKKQASGLDKFASMSQTDKIKDAIKKLREARRMDMGSGREGDVRTAVRQFL